MHDLSLQTNRFLRALPEEDRQRLLIAEQSVPVLGGKCSARLLSSKVANAMDR
jgi:hypothetical protein